MTENYDDQKLVENFEEVARAYAKSLKNKGFVFIKLQQEDFSMLLDEISIIFGKLLASFEILSQKIDCNIILNETQKEYRHFRKLFDYQSVHKFSSDMNYSQTFLAVFALENLLNQKILLLAQKSGEITFCHKVIDSRAKIYAESFDTDDFRLDI